MRRLLTLLATLCVSTSLHAQQWLELVAADQPITVTASGIVEAADSLRFGPPANRRWRVTITEMAREGSRVKTGDTLVRFDGSATDDRIRELTAELNAKQSERESLLETQAREIEDGKVRLAAARSAADKAERKASGDAELFASLEYQKLVEQRDVAQWLYQQEQKRVELVARVRESKQAELQADIRRLESELAGAQRELESFTIRAPRDGLVIVGLNNEGQKLDVNDSVNPGMVVVQLADDSELVLHAEVPEYAANQIAVGQRAAITIDAAGGSEVSGEVVEVASLVRRQSVFSQAMVRDVEVSLPASAVANLRPGMSAKLEIMVDTQQNALAVPDVAFRYRDGMPGLVVRGDGWRPVKLGRSSADGHIVEEGVMEGEEVSL